MRPSNVVIAGKIWWFVDTSFTRAGEENDSPRSVDRTRTTSASPVPKSAQVRKTVPDRWLTAVRGKVSRRYALPGRGSGTGTTAAIPRSASNVAPQSRDRVNKIWSLWKLSHATYTSPPGPTATVVPWFCEFGGWLRWMMELHDLPPSVDR